MGYGYYNAIPFIPLKPKLAKNTKPRTAARIKYTTIIIRYETIMYTIFLSSGDFFKGPIPRYIKYIPYTQAATESKEPITGIKESNPAIYEGVPEYATNWADLLMSFSEPKLVANASTIYVEI